MSIAPPWGPALRRCVSLAVSAMTQRITPCNGSSQHCTDGGCEAAGRHAVQRECCTRHARRIQSCAVVATMGVASSRQKAQRNKRPPPPPPPQCAMLKLNPTSRTGTPVYAERTVEKLPCYAWFVQVDVRGAGVGRQLASCDSGQHLSGTCLPLEHSSCTSRLHLCLC